VADEQPPRAMTIREHLEELRTRLVRSLLAISVGFAFAFWRIEDVMAFMRKPLEEAVGDPDIVDLIQTKAYGAFVGAMKISFFTGCVLAAPIILQQMWAFVAAGLYRHERRTVKYYAFPGFLLFVAGCALAYFWVVPWALQFLVGFAEKMAVESLWEFSEYLSLVAFSMFVFGLMFQLPLLMVFLMRLGVVQPDTFRRYRKHFIVASFAIAAILTPPDVVSQLALAGCMALLYEGAILVGARVARPREEEGS
jgi:sec-independent protein translocase protein TatC